jgi:signal peptidase II
LLPWFNLTLLYNQGAAFSFLDGAGSWAAWMLGTLAVIVSVALIIWMLRTPPQKRWLLASLALILGGALGNVIDRIHQGYVVDFLLFHYKTWYFPAFNFADSAITAGAIMLVMDMIFFNREETAHD